MILVALKHIGHAYSILFCDDAPSLLFPVSFINTVSVLEGFA